VIAGDLKVIAGDLKVIAVLGFKGATGWHF
jgi:hypothetical protein